MNTYLTIDEQDEKYIINVEISDSEKIDRNKLNKTIKQISKFIKKNDKKRKDVIINTNLDLEKDEKENGQMLTLISALNACKIRKKKKRIIPPNKGNVSDRDIAKKGISHSILPLLPFPHHATPGGRGHIIIFMSSRRSWKLVAAAEPLPYRSRL